MSRRLAVVLATALAVLLGAAPPALAHDRLEGTAPADGEQLAAPPQEVVLTFSAPVTDADPEVVVRDGSGADVAAGAVTKDGARLVLPLRADLASGRYTVDWEVLGSDGHARSGAFAFRVTAPDPPPATAAPGSTPAEAATTPATTPATPTTPSTPAVSGPAVSPAAGQGAPADDRGSGLPLWLLAAPVLLLVAAGVLLARRRSR